MLDNWSFHLSPSPSTSSSARSSHLSVLTSVSSAASPLPSPTGSKTHAFFASPFGDDSSMPQPPPNPPKRTTSLKSDAPSLSSSSEVSAEDTPRIEHKAPARSLNDEFFGPSTLPTPPPSIRSFSSGTSAAGSRDNSTSPPSARLPLPPLSRFFPSRARYGTESDHLPTTNVRRDLVNLDTCGPQSPAAPYHHQGEQTISPVDLEHSHASSSSLQVTPTPTRREETARVASRVPPSPPASECEQQPHQTKLEPGAMLSSSSLTLELVKPLGTGTFSSVWLARDTQGQLGALELMRKSSLARSKSFRRGRSRAIDGTRPTRKKAPKDNDRQTVDGRPVLSPDEGGPDKSLDNAKAGRLVAVKMTERAVCNANSRSRVSFVREVEVLRHIAHPSIVSYLHSFSTPSHHCLVLEHVAGGELLELVDDPVRHAQLDEPLVRRIWGELCKAVAWMHSVGLVHRDIKLENILLTTDPFTQPLPSSSLIKLTDFGLSRFIDPAQPLLTTLCGSESYAAPELVMGRPYDGRETDAWACGVVLYALATRRLPFDPPPTPGFAANGAGGIPHESRMKVEAEWESRMLSHFAIGWALAVPWLPAPWNCR
ncbi:hypothetical protein BN946_scf184940.g15 [Trametes cinnabarina]|uniref:Protein kinase domain-containing protein n=1 Tax=Pycnoporus cinnabarinus TaxID=5643 RepID=A0A060SHH8_PYCCI|nr:hypothetical protein BN946_scf184940.g15 [Trametes cinnabarina]